MCAGQNDVMKVFRPAARPYDPARVMESRHGVTEQEMITLMDQLRLVHRERESVACAPARP